MSAQVELFKLLTEYEHKLRKLLLKHERKTPAPEVEYKPEPRLKPKGKPGSQEWYASLPPCRTDDGISMNALARSVARA